VVIIEYVKLFTLEFATATLYLAPMQTVIETRAYLRDAEEAGMTEEERELVVLHLAKNPHAGDIMKETGGCRKVRIAREGTGKSAGYRVITYFGGRNIPLFLLTVFAKGQKANLSKGERNALAKLTGTLKASLGQSVTTSRRRT
jgi:hypothetical protein